MATFFYPISGIYHYMYKPDENDPLKLLKETMRSNKDIIAVITNVHDIVLVDIVDFEIWKKQDQIDQKLLLRKTFLEKFFSYKIIAKTSFTISINSEEWKIMHTL